MKWKPLYDKIIVELNNKQETVSEAGIRVVQNMSTNKYTVLEAKVVACGEGRLLQDGTIKPLIVKEGDIVKFSKMQGESFVEGDKEYTIISESNILALTRKEE